MKETPKDRMLLIIENAVNDFKAETGVSVQSIDFAETTDLALAVTYVEYWRGNG